LELTKEIKDLYNRASGVAQVVERLPSKHEALNLNPMQQKKRKKKKMGLYPSSLGW
jgi:hypothetical protein